MTQKIIINDLKENRQDNKKYILRKSCWQLSRISMN